MKAAKLYDAGKFEEAAKLCNLPSESEIQKEVWRITEIELDREE
jgi:hypothetical protein